MELIGTDSLILKKDSYELSHQIVPFRAWQWFANQQIIGQNRRSNYEATNLIAEETELSKKHVDVQGNKISFPRLITAPEAPRGNADTILLNKGSIDSDH